MVSHLHRLSSMVFYILGTSFFVAYLLLNNGLVVGLSGWWLRSLDLPLILAGILYGGSSLYLSVRPGRTGEKGLALFVGLPLAVIFAFLVVMNFWGLTL